MKRYEWLIFFLRQVLERFLSFLFCSLTKSSTTPTRVGPEIVLFESRRQNRLDANPSYGNTDRLGTTVLSSPAFRVHVILQIALPRELDRYDPTCLVYVFDRERAYIRAVSIYVTSFTLTPFFRIVFHQTLIETSKKKKKKKTKTNSPTSIDRFISKIIQPRCDLYGINIVDTGMPYGV